MDLVGGSGAGQTGLGSSFYGTVRGDLLYAALFGLAGMMYPGVFGTAGRLAGLGAGTWAGARVGILLGGITATLFGTAEKVKDLSSDAQVVSNKISSILEDKNFARGVYGNQLSRFKMDLDYLSSLSAPYQEIHPSSNVKDIEVAKVVTDPLMRQISKVSNDIENIKKSIKNIETEYEKHETGLLTGIKHFFSPVFKSFDAIVDLSRSIETLEDSINHFKDSYNNSAEELKRKAQEAADKSGSYVSQSNIVKYRDIKRELNSRGIQLTNEEIQAAADRNGVYIEGMPIGKSKEQSDAGAEESLEGNSDSELPSVTKPSKKPTTSKSNGDVIITNEELEALKSLPKAAKIKYFADKIKIS